MKDTEEDKSTLSLCTEKEDYENTEILTHDNISAHDMYCFEIMSGRCGGDRVMIPVKLERWKWEWDWWLSDFTIEIKSEADAYVAYNVQEYTVSKS